MSLFQSLSDMSKQHAEAGRYNFGLTYKEGDKCVVTSRIHGHFFDIGTEVTIIRVLGGFGDPSPYEARFGDQVWFVGGDEIKPIIEEPAPTVSLYNLLDHSRDDLDILHGIVRSFTRDKIEPIKDSVPAHYTSAIAWIRILETAMKERERRDSEAWAEKTAKEINETL